MTDDTPTEIVEGDCIEQMQDMDENSVHAVVTDPPYGLAFMPGVNEWDSFESPKDYQDFCEEWATECRRVLKPGGHLIAFSGNRTYGRLMCGVQDAGFEIRDTLTWHHGEGFPKSSDISKHIDRYYNAEDERENLGVKGRSGGNRTNINGSPDNGREKDTYEGEYYETKPATSAAEKWDGWKTRLKPATEFAVLARAPMSEDAIYKNVLEHGTGALNIDRTRSSDGRYPANLLLDPEAARMLDSQSGECGSSDGNAASYSEDESVVAYGDGLNGKRSTGYSKVDGASRFFYTAKASKSERTIDGQIENEHPTVKPLSLMSWLVTLVTAPGQRVLDPFAGSGTTIMACRRLGREGIGIEKDPDHAELARKRVELALDESLETEFDVITEETNDESDDGPATLESFGDDD